MRLLEESEVYEEWQAEIKMAIIAEWEAGCATSLNPQLIARHNAGWEVFAETEL
ncbi:MAG: hypothetical protein ACI8RZ_002917 [Myxococcota bacterium]|jgi:hypothetical protein